MSKFIRKYWPLALAAVVFIVVLSQLVTVVPCTEATGYLADACRASGY